MCDVSRIVPLVPSAVVRASRAAISSVSTTLLLLQPANWLYPLTSLCFFLNAISAWPAICKLQYYIVVCTGGKHPLDCPVKYLAIVVTCINYI